MCCCFIIIKTSFEGSINKNICLNKIIGKIIANNGKVFNKFWNSCIIEAEADRNSDIVYLKDLLGNRIE